MCLPARTLETRRRRKRPAWKWTTTWHRLLSQDSASCDMCSSRPHDCLLIPAFTVLILGVGVGFDPNLFLCTQAWPYSFGDTCSSHRTRIIHGSGPDSSTRKLAPKLLSFFSLPRLIYLIPHMFSMIASSELLFTLSSLFRLSYRYIHLVYTFSIIDRS